MAEQIFEHERLNRLFARRTWPWATPTCTCPARRRASAARVDVSPRPHRDPWRYRRRRGRRGATAGRHVACWKRLEAANAQAGHRLLTGKVIDLVQDSIMPVELSAECGGDLDAGDPRRRRGRLRR